MQPHKAALKLSEDAITYRSRMDKNRKRWRKDSWATPNWNRGRHGEPVKRAIRIKNVYGKCPRNHVKEIFNKEKVQLRVEEETGRGARCLKVTDNTDEGWSNVLWVKVAKNDVYDLHV